MSSPHPPPHRLGSRAPHTSGTPAATSKQTSSPVQKGVPALRHKASPQPATPHRQKQPWDPKACSAVTLKLRTNLLSRWGASTLTLSLLQGQVQLSKKTTPVSHILSHEPPLQPCTKVLSISLMGKLYPWKGSHCSRSHTQRMSQGVRLCTTSTIPHSFTPTQFPGHPIRSQIRAAVKGTNQLTVLALWALKLQTARFKFCLCYLLLPASRTWTSI